MGEERVADEADGWAGARMEVRVGASGGTGSDSRVSSPHPWARHAGPECHSILQTETGAGRLNRGCLSGSQGVEGRGGVAAQRLWAWLSVQAFVTNTTEGGRDLCVLLPQAQRMRAWPWPPLLGTEPRWGHLWVNFLMPRSTVGLWKVNHFSCVWGSSPEGRRPSRQ